MSPIRVEQTSHWLQPVMCPSFNRQWCGENGIFWLSVLMKQIKLDSEEKMEGEWILPLRFLLQGSILLRLKSQYHCHAISPHGTHASDSSYNLERQWNFLEIELKRSLKNPHKLRKIITLMQSFKWKQTWIKNKKSKTQTFPLHKFWSLPGWNAMWEKEHHSSGLTTTKKIHNVLKAILQVIVKLMTSDVFEW